MRNISITIIIFFLTFSGKLAAQINSDSTDNDQVIVSEGYPDNNQIDVPSKALLKRGKVHPGLEVGTSFTYSPGNFFGPSFYVAPNLSYMVTPRFMLQTGFGLERSNFQTIYDNNGNDNGVLPMTRAFFYASGSYLLNSKITVDQLFLLKT